jgi:hypothetical protein
MRQIYKFLAGKVHVRKSLRVPERSGRVELNLS